MILYVAGPMRGRHNFNRLAFESAREWLRERGHEVICPAENTDASGKEYGGVNRPFHLKRDLRHILDQCDGVVVLDDWQASEGAKLEAAMALEVGLRVALFQPHINDVTQWKGLSLEDHPWYNWFEFGDLRKFSAEYAIWRQHNFPDADSTQQLLGVGEEVGELMHAQLKGIQAIRHTPEEIRDMKEDAVGDIVVYLQGYCELEGINFADAVRRAWGEVRHRDWIKYPTNGKDK